MKETHDIVNIQREAWQMDDLGIVPTFETKAVASVGTVLIAVDKNDRGIGFIYAYDQIPDSHYSHMMAVLPEYHGKSIGFAMKISHRKIALERNIKFIRWTVDPLLPNNAYLNFAKLGGVCNKYYVNYYGSPDVEGIEIYSGLDTDRFLLEWRINTPRVERRINNYKDDRIYEEELLERSPVVNSIEENQPVGKSDELEQTLSFTVEIPADFQEIRRKTPHKAQMWREYFRKICLHYFKNGFHAIDYHSFVGENRRNYYEFGKLD